MTECQRKLPNQKKVFDALRNCITEPKCKDCPWEDCERFGHKKTEVPVTLLLDVLELLKAQEPVPPKFDTFSALCGNCGGVLDVAEPDPYCPMCGKAVKWE